VVVETLVTVGEAEASNLHKTVADNHNKVTRRLRSSRTVDWVRTCSRLRAHSASRSTSSVAPNDVP
jgi:hypothetical protein